MKIRRKCKGKGERTRKKKKKGQLNGLISPVDMSFTVPVR
jgi:hypothetical protein